jgi:hypothetical protein
MRVKGEVNGRQKRNTGYHGSIILENPLANQGFSMKFKGIGSRIGSEVPICFSLVGRQKARVSNHPPAEPGAFGIAVPSKGAYRNPKSKTNSLQTFCVFEPLQITSFYTPGNVKLLLSPGRAGGLPCLFSPTRFLPHVRHLSINMIVIILLLIWKWN